MEEGENSGAGGEEMNEEKNQPKRQNKGGQKELEGKEAKKIEDEKERVKFIEYIKNPPPRCIKQLAIFGSGLLATLGHIFYNK